MAAKLNPGEMDFTILPDGTVKLETGDLGVGAVHKSADDFLRDVEKLLGGDTTTSKAKAEHGHHHSHERGGHHHRR